jgi:alpha-1,6-mannosyltransferase
VPQLRHGLPARGLFRLTIDLSRDPFPAPLRAGASLAVLDITEYFSETSGGIRTYLLAKSGWIARHPEFRQVLVVPGGRDDLSDADGVRTYRLQGPPIPLNSQYRLLLSTRTTRKILEHERPDLIEVGSHLFVPWVARIANRKLHVPLVWFYHGHLPHLIAPGRDGGIIQRAVWAYVRLMARGCQGILVASRFLADELRAHGIDRVEYAPLGVDLRHFDPARRAKRPPTRAAYGLPEGKLALFAGRYAREKQVKVLLDAWAEVERRTGARLVLVGDGPREDELRAHPYGSRVTWLPFERDREKFADLLAAVDLYLAPGPYETFGLAALEALASGTPVLSVDRGGVAEQVKESGAGALYPEGSATMATAGAISLLNGDLLALGAKGRRFAEEQHSWEVVLPKLFAAYRRLAGR